MKRRLTTLAFLCGMASAQSAPKVNVFALDISPENQRLVANYTVDVGFPAGKQTGTLEMECKKSGIPVVKAWKEVKMDTYEEDPAGSKAILASKAIQITGTAALINAWYGPLRFYCKSGVLYTDFSKLAADPALQGNLTDATAHFGIEQRGLMRTINFEYPLNSTIREDGRLVPHTVSLHLLSRTGLKAGEKIMREIYFDGVAREGKSAVFLLDTKSSTLLPLRYGGNEEGLKKVFNRALDPKTLILYYAADYSAVTGWRKLTIDFVNSLIWTQDVGKPNVKFGN